jgi:redox-sensitive bicupin YhaK (pirin superfamily)
MSDDIVLRVGPLGFPWTTEDPFLFCVHHDDAYPAGNERLGPAASLAGRNLGQDFEGKDGWRMYHGDIVPGFPQHPHRGFETVTMVRRGFIDHSDSLGATARFGQGDVQWLTAGRGILHAEMFPLLDSKGPNPLELFQIWLNLPSTDKLVEPHFSMLWNHTLARHTTTDGDGNTTALTVVAGTIAGSVAPSPPPHSWAARPDHDVAIVTIAMAPRARFTLPRAHAGTNRTLFFFRGETLQFGGRTVAGGAAVKVRSDADVVLENGPTPSELLLLQGQPIGEPVVQYGPFVMNSPAEIQQAIIDYRRTEFGGWPWPNHGPVHARSAGRFAKHADGRREDVG